MKIKLLATGQSPDYYTIDGETIIAHVGEQQEEIDLSDFPEEAKWEGAETEVLELRGSQIIRNVDRVDGELEVILCQKAPVSKVTYFLNGKRKTVLATDPEPSEYDKKVKHRGGHWTESDWIDASDYEPEKLYIKEVTDEI